jgi:PAS domain S-box-containing protein
MDSVRDYAIFMLDTDGRIRSWNAGAMALKGYTADEVIGRHFSLFYTPEDQAAGKPATELRQAQAIGRVEDEGWRVRKDGNLFWANVIITAMHDDTGALVGFAKITRDMTTRKRLEELERSSRMMNEFLAMLAHELRNPLAPMRNAVTLMQLEPLASPSLRNSRDIIDRQLTHVTRLVDDLLDVGRITTGKVKLRRELVRVADVVMRSCETVRPLIEARKHGLTVEVPAEPIYINADPTRVSQILQNLMVNAAKYTPDGGHIVISAKQIDGFVCIAVEDTGRGIEERDLQRIFELFMQGENGSPSESGLGIGLTLARSLAELHGGRLDAQSEGVGKGSTFILRLPVARQAEAVSDDQEQALRPQGLRVLVVDDNRDAADSATAIIRMLGDDAECAYSGAGALESVRRSVPDVVLLDLAMPVLDGFATLRQLREVPGMEHAFVVAMTGYGSTDDKRRTTGAGFDAHVTKPVDLNQLLALLKQAREQRAAPPSTGN